jgi:hypothetical protein
MIKKSKEISAIAILMLLLVSTVASTVLAIPTKEAKTKAAVASWTIDSPKTGGWVFAAVMQSQDPTNDNKIFVSGYHPAGAAGPSTKAFSGWGTCSEFEWFMDHVSAKATINFDVITISPTGVTTKSIVQHTVEITWTTINPTTSGQIKGTVNGVTLDVAGMGRNADATITITKSSTTDHNTWTTSSGVVVHAEKFSMIVP